MLFSNEAAKEAWRAAEVEEAVLRAEAQHKQAQSVLTSAPVVVDGAIITGFIRPLTTQICYCNVVLHALAVLGGVNGIEHASSVFDGMTDMLQMWRRELVSGEGEGGVNPVAMINEIGVPNVKEQQDPGVFFALLDNHFRPTGLYFQPETDSGGLVGTDGTHILCDIEGLHNNLRLTDFDGAPVAGKPFGLRYAWELEAAVVKEFSRRIRDNSVVFRPDLHFKVSSNFPRSLALYSNKLFTFCIDVVEREAHQPLQAGGHLRRRPPEPRCFDEVAAGVASGGDDG